MTTLATRLAKLKAQFLQHRCSTRGTQIAIEIRQVEREMREETKRKIEERNKRK